ncbi:MAG: DEAD/DEAH box helicase [Oceanococcus sp.]
MTDAANLDKLKSLLMRFGVARLSQLVGIETLENMERWFRVRVTAPNLVAILIQRHGSSILGNALIRKALVDHLEEFDRNYVLSGSSRVTWSSRSATTQRLVQTLGVGDGFLPREKEEKPQSILSICPQAPLHDFQFNVKARILGALYSPSSRVLMHMPTGAGKTRTACEVMVDVLRAEPPGPAIIVWLAHSEELCQQAVESIEQSWALKGDHKVSITRLWGGFDKPTEVPSRGFVVASFQSVYSMLTSTSMDLSLLRVIGGATKLIVVDEAHKATAPTYDIAITTLSMASTPPKILGLTATPGRGEDEDENLKLSKFFDNTKIGLCDNAGTPLSDGIGYLQELGVLAKLQRERIETNLSIDLTNDEITKLSNLMELPSSFLKRLGGQHERNLLIFNRLMELSDARRQVILFACSVAQAELFSDLCVARNISARLITGSTDAFDRARWIDEYKRCDVQILINYGVLTTGFDAPNTDTVFITRPTASVVLYSQMIGRAIRGPKNGGNETAKIIDVVDNLIGMPSENMAYNYFNDIWSL